VWTVIYMATDMGTAHEVEEAMQREGILVKLKQVMKSKRHGCCIEVQVPESEAQEAQQIILERNL